MSLLLPLRWKSDQDQFRLPPVLLAYQHPEPTSSQWTIWPKPGDPDTWFQSDLGLNICGLKHSYLLIGKSDGHSAIWLPNQDSQVQICCSLHCELHSILGTYFLDREPTHHPPLAPKPLLHQSMYSFRPQWSLSVGQIFATHKGSYSFTPKIHPYVRYSTDKQPLEQIYMDAIQSILFF